MCSLRSPYLIRLQLNPNVRLMYTVANGVENSVTPSLEDAAVCGEH